MDKDSTAYPASSLLTDSCDVYGPPATYWVGSAGSSGHAIILNLACTVTIDREVVPSKMQTSLKDIHTKIYVQPFFIMDLIVFWMVHLSRVVVKSADGYVAGATSNFKTQVSWKRTGKTLFWADIFSLSFCQNLDLNQLVVW